MNSGGGFGLGLGFSLTPTAVIQVTNLSSAVTSEQMRTLFSFLGEIEELRLYPPEWVLELGWGRGAGAIEIWGSEARGRAWTGARGARHVTAGAYLGAHVWFGHRNSEPLGRALLVSRTLGVIPLHWDLTKVAFFVPHRLVAAKFSNSVPPSTIFSRT